MIEASEHASKKLLISSANMKKTKDIFIDPDDNSTTRIARATECCGGYHQTIAGALLMSKEWKLWCKEVSRRIHEGKWKEEVYDTDECESIDVMSDQHFASFCKFIKKLK